MSADLETKLDMKKALLLLTTLFCCIFNALAQENIEPEEYEVYKAWMEKSFITFDTKQVFITKFTTDSFSDFAFLEPSKKRQISQLQSSTFKDYKLRNQKSLEAV